MSKTYKIKVFGIDGISGNDEEYEFKEITGQWSVTEVANYIEQFWEIKEQPVNFVSIKEITEVYETLSDNDSVRL